jgi:hypothetical protein
VAQNSSQSETGVLYARRIVWALSRVVRWSRSAAVVGGRVWNGQVVIRSSGNHSKPYFALFCLILPLLPHEALTKQINSNKWQ